METFTFDAPWGKPLKIMTAVAALILIGVSILGIFAKHPHNVFWLIFMVKMPLIILIISAVFIIRGYELNNETLFVKRLGWSSKIDLAKLVSVQIDPEAMARSIRTFGNGGLFCFAGAFWNKKLGSYRAFATDFKNCVILKFSDRTVVITPAEPEMFAAKIKSLKAL